jgi:hypothetical protein
MDLLDAEKKCSPPVIQSTKKTSPQRRSQQIFSSPLLGDKDQSLLSSTTKIKV